MSHLRRVAATLAATAVALTPGLLGSAQAAPPPLPHDDAFYQYGVDGTPATPPPTSQPGDVLDSRSVTLPTMVDLINALAAQNGQPFTTFAAASTQLLYRTQDELGRPSATVTTVIEPTVVNPDAVSKGVVAYLSYYDGLSDSCDPSYTLQDTSINGEKAVIGSLLEQGYTVTIPDFEGEGLDWAAGHEAGWNTLDAIRATESSLGLPASTKVGMIGYSGGSIAGEWASELAPTYAPALDLVGTAIGGIPVNLGDVMKYVDSAADTDRDQWAGVIPAAMVSLGRAVGKDFAAEYGSSTPTYPEGAPTLSGQDIAAQVSDKCIDGFRATYPGLHVADLLQDPTSNFLAEPDVKPLVDSLVMGNGAAPTAPMLMVQGNKDGIGDGVMVAADVKALALKYCQAGLPVQYSEVAGKAHGDVGTTFMLQGIGYLAGRFGGQAAPSTCPPAAVPVVKHAIHPKLHAHTKGRHDILVVKAAGATGAKVKVFRLHHGHQTKVGHGVVDKHGKARIKVTDHNGSAKTRYRAKVAATTTTLAAVTRVVKQR
jgi:hypothetical protein